MPKTECAWHRDYGCCASRTWRSTQRLRIEWGLLRRPSLPLRRGDAVINATQKSFGGNSELAEHADRKDFPLSGDSVAKLRPRKLLPRHAYPWILSRSSRLTYGWWQVWVKHNRVSPMTSAVGLRIRHLLVDPQGPTTSWKIIAMVKPHQKEPRCSVSALPSGNYNCSGVLGRRSLRGWIRNTSLRAQLFIHCADIGLEHVDNIEGLGKY